MFAVPLRFGPFHLGAVDVYSKAPMHVSAEQAGAAKVLADTVSRWLLQRVITRQTSRRPVQVEQLEQRKVHQATGFVLAQLDLSPSDAHLFIRAHAAVRDEDAAATASLILDRQLSITRDGDLVPNAGASGL